MTVSHAAHPARISGHAAHTDHTARVRTRADIAALYRRVLLRAELLLTIAAAPRPGISRGR